MVPVPAERRLSGSGELDRDARHDARRHFSASLRHSRLVAAAAAGAMACACLRVSLKPLATSRLGLRALLANAS